MDQAQNTFSALQMLPKNGNFTMRWFVFCAGADHHDNSQTIGLTHRGVKPMPATLVASVSGSNIFGGRATAMTAPSGKVEPFPFQLEGTR
jgi:hypothetical protein